MDFKDLAPRKDPKGGSPSPETFTPKASARLYKSPFMLFLAGQVIMFIFWVGGASYFSGQFAQRFYYLEARTAHLEAEQSRMDNNGTNASRTGLRIDENRLADVEAHANANEQILRKVPVMEASINRIEADIKEIKAVIMHH